MTAWLNPHSGAAPMRADIISAIPRIETPRLILRAPELSDWPVLETVFTTDRAAFVGGPLTAFEAWTEYCQLTASWILHGFGALVMTDRTTADVLGMVLLHHEYGDEEPELGWMVIAEAEGYGFATEAALPLRDLGLRLFGPGGFVSHIAEGNDRSVAVAVRLAAVRDAAPHPRHEELSTWRYGVTA